MRRNFPLRRWRRRSESILTSGTCDVNEAIDANLRLNTPSQKSCAAIARRKWPCPSGGGNRDVVPPTNSKTLFLKFSNQRVNARVACRSFRSRLVVSKLWGKVRTSESLLSAAEREESGRGDWIRTSDLFVPNEARYQAAPRPDTKSAGNPVSMPSARRLAEGPPSARGAYSGGCCRNPTARGT